MNAITIFMNFIFQLACELKDEYLAFKNWKP